MTKRQKIANYRAIHVKKASFQSFYHSINRFHAMNFEIFDQKLPSAISTWLISIFGFLFGDFWFQIRIFSCRTEYNQFWKVLT